MQDHSFKLREWTNPVQTIARHLLTIGENRLELLAVEVQEERDRLLHALLMAFGVVMCALMCMACLTAAIVIALWAWSPMGVLLILTGVYAVAALIIYAWLKNMMDNWQALSASIEQLRKDSKCLQEMCQ